VTARSRRFIAASAVSAAVILAAPIMGQVRGLLRAAFPGHFVAIVGAMVAGAAGAAMVTALLRIKVSRRARYGALAAALAIGVGYSLASRSGVADVDAVERFHFVEYGVITILFYRAWRERGDASAFVLPVLAALVVSSLDEWLQWFVPVRVGELHDALLNLVAICCGLLVGVAVEPPEEFSTRLHPQSAAATCAACAVALLVFAGFVSAAHLGYTVFAPSATFRSHYTHAQLDSLSRERSAQWRTNPPLALRRFSREDQYMDEGLWHIRRRNERWSTGDYLGAWNENLILEEFFTPVLDTPSYAMPKGGRWPSEQRADAESRARDSGPQATMHGMAYVSDAQPYPIFIWPKRLFWSAVAAVVFVALACARRASAAASR
jgi:VanZ family protein